MSDVRNRVIELIEDVLGVGDGEMSSTMRLKEDLGGDEFDVTELVMILEDELDIELTSPDYVTVGELVEACEVEVRRKN
jgi:acyl carrier protein